MNRIITQLKTFFESPSEDACRIFHGRGQRFPGLETINIDWFNPYLMIILYQEIKQADLLKITDFIHQHATRHVKGIILQERFKHKSPNHVIYGNININTNHIVTEHGLKYQLTLTKNQNTGLFLDMSNTRQWLINHASEKSVLNLFAYTCSLSVAAIKGKAKSIINVDMSKSALTSGRNNHLLNNQDTKKVMFMPYNILKSWSRIGKKGPYDLVIIDPPEFQKGSFVVEKDYAKIVRRLRELMPNGGEVIAALNVPRLGSDFLKSLFSSECPDAVFCETIPTPEIFINKNEERGLKVLLFRLE